MTAGLEQFIKMRLAAIPDLGMGTPMGFSINWRAETILIDEKGDWYYSTKDEACQLERQDQLQAMVEGHCGYFHLVSRFVGWGGSSQPIDGKDIIPFTDMVLHNQGFEEWPETRHIGKLPQFVYEQFTSMRQLWLAAVMDWLYQKHWTGTEWQLTKPRG